MFKDCIDMQMNKSAVYKNYTLILLLATLVWAVPLWAQVTEHVPSKDRGNPLYRRKSNLDGNNVRVTVQNYGVNGWSGSKQPGEYGFEWPKNTDREHVVFVSLWMGGEVNDKDGNTIRIVDLPTFRTKNGATQNNEPVPGFLNPNSGQIARSDEKVTWPTAAQGGWRDKQSDPVDPGWIGSWNGFFGKNIFNADLEMFYRASDDLYTKYVSSYTPDDTDPTRGGLALLVDERALAWTQVLINDVVFFIYDIKNDGTKRIPKTTFTLWMADLVGGDADDDQPFLDQQTDITFFTDADRIGNKNWGDDPVGVASVKLLETPGNQIDGIDNDGDADQHLSVVSQIDGDPLIRVPHFTNADFEERILMPGDKIVLIDSLTLQRRVVTYPANGGTVKSLGFEYNLPAGGITLYEDTASVDLKDDDLDGLIDETLELHLERFNQISGTIEPVRYINYLSFEVGDTIKRGFIVPGLKAEMKLENMAPMIDESRDDGFDNDNDWVMAQDDVGLDGKENTGDVGEGDGQPTSGSGTGFPGEPNIDKTDVSETDLIGLSGARQAPEGSITNWNEADADLWNKYMTPGKFTLFNKKSKSDLWITSGYFTIEPGERQRMAVSAALAGGGNTKQDDINSAISKQEQARIAYDTDYRFAKAPLQVTVTAVPGDGKVTLYWDDLAESSIDEFIKQQGGDPEDFEGYRIYRATDAAFLDAKTITDNKGVPLLLNPIKIFDKKDGKKGNHPVPIFGANYYMGDDSGIKHSFVDSTVTNGQRYFYAVTSFDFGFAAGNIAPSESPIRVDVGPQGDIITGSNIVVVRPRSAVAGYIPANVESFEHVSGTSSGEVSISIVDPRALRTGDEYELTFEDTLITSPLKNYLATKNFSLQNLTTGDTLINRSPKVEEGYEIKETQGFRLALKNAGNVRIDEERTKWSDSNIFDYQFSQINFLSIKGVEKANDYELVFGPIGTGAAMDTSLLFYNLPAKTVNFKVNNITTGAPIAFAFDEKYGTDGRFNIDPADANNTDSIFLLEENEEGKLEYTWQIILNTQPVGARNPVEGDTLKIYLIKPFLKSDVYRFTMKGETFSKKKAKQELDEIKVVPNPYIASVAWETRNTFNTGRGPREIHFNNLPNKCTIRIFTVNGQLVDTIEHSSLSQNANEQSRLLNAEDSGVNNGTAIWDMLSKDNLEIAYGIYIYHVDAPGIGRKTGTFAIIK